MRKLVYYVAVSLDGFIAGPGHQFEAFLAEGDHATVLFGEFGDAIPSEFRKAVGMADTPQRFDTVVMGWNTYLPGLDAGYPSPYAHLRQVIASRSARDVPDEIELTDDPLTTVRALKAEDGLDIYLAGGGDLAGQLIDEIDELVIKRNPMAFGTGIPLFGHHPYRVVPFAHERTRSFESGVVISEYARG